MFPHRLEPCRINPWTARAFPPGPQGLRILTFRLPKRLTLKGMLGETDSDFEGRLRAAIGRAYQAAGLRLRERDLASLASVYAGWAAGADEGVVGRIERALAASLGVPSRC